MQLIFAYRLLYHQFWFFFVKGGIGGCDYDGGSGFDGASGYDGVDGCDYDGDSGYDGAGGCVFFSLFHTLRVVQFNAVMTIDNKIITRMSYIVCINAAYCLICSLRILFLKIY